MLTQSQEIKGTGVRSLSPALASHPQTFTLTHVDGLTRTQAFPGRCVACRIKWAFSRKGGCPRDTLGSERWCVACLPQSGGWNLTISSITKELSAHSRQHIPLIRKYGLLKNPAPWGQGRCHSRSSVDFLLWTMRLKMVEVRTISKDLGCSESGWTSCTLNHKGWRREALSDPGKQSFCHLHYCYSWENKP